MLPPGWNGCSGGGATMHGVRYPGLAGEPGYNKQKRGQRPQMRVQRDVRGSGITQAGVIENQKINLTN